MWTTLYCVHLRPVLLQGRRMHRLYSITKAVLVYLTLPGMPIMWPVAVCLYADNKNSLHQVQSLSLFRVCIRHAPYIVYIIFTHFWIIFFSGHSLRVHIEYLPMRGRYTLHTTCTYHSLRDTRHGGPIYIYITHHDV